MEDVPISVQSDVAYNIYKNILREISFLRSENEAFVADVCARLRTVIYPENCIVYRAGERGSDLYIVKKGIVETLDMDLRTVVSVGGDCSFFGEAAIINFCKIKYYGTPLVSGAEPDQGVDSEVVYFQSGQQRTESQGSDSGGMFENMRNESEVELALGQQSPYRLSRISSVRSGTGGAGVSSNNSNGGKYIFIRRETIRCRTRCIICKLTFHDLEMLIEAHSELLPKLIEAHETQRRFASC